MRPSVFDSLPDLIAAIIVAGCVLIVCVVLYAPHKPTRPGVLLMGDRSVQCLDAIPQPDGSLTVVTVPDMQRVTVAAGGGWLYVEGAGR